MMFMDVVLMAIIAGAGLLLIILLRREVRRKTKSLLREILERRRVENEVREQRNVATTYLQVAGVMLCSLDARGQVTLINKKGLEILGYNDEQELLGRNWFDVAVPEAAVADVRGVFARMMAGDVGPVEYHENLVKTSRGEERLIAFHNALLHDSDGQVAGVFFSGDDITARKKAERELNLSRLRYQTLFDKASDGIMFMDKEGRIIGANESFARMHGYSVDEITTMNIRALIVNSNSRLVQERMAQIMQGETLQFEVTHITKDGRVVQQEISTSFITIGTEKFVQSFHRDITERKLLEGRLITIARSDALTQLPNRVCFLEKAGQEILRAKRTGHLCAVLFVDLDHFKNVNDTLGHSVGDELLKDSAAKLVTCIRETDILARLGGDEFSVLLSDLESINDAQAIAERIREKFNAPRIIVGNDLFVTASVGIAVHPSDGEHLEDLLKNADTAMYAAKASGRNTYCFFDQVMHENAASKMKVERYLRDALEKKEFALFYQPIVSMADGKVRGFEALLRWFKADGELVLPGEFIGVAEETGLIIAIGEWALHEACRFNKRLCDEGHAGLVMSVNMSVAQLRWKNLVGIIKSALDQSGLPPHLLEVEVTESLFIESLDEAIGVLNAIRDLGVHVSLDDFGTGYSSLVHLLKLPIGSLKIDRIFIREIARDGDENAMIPAIIDLAHKLKLQVIAEGVEAGAQVEKLLRDRCDYYQGYYLSKPIKADEVLPFLATH